MLRIAAFVIICIIAFSAGHMIATIAFFGLLLFAGFAGLVEFITPLKWIVYRCSAAIDVLLWVLSAASIAVLGVTIAGALGVASLAFTFAYRPIIQKRMAAIRNNKKQSKS